MHERRLVNHCVLDWRFATLLLSLGMFPAQITYTFQTDNQQLIIALCFHTTFKLPVGQNNCRSMVTLNFRWFLGCFS
jgi:hypothetical protein